MNPVKAMIQSTMIVVAVLSLVSCAAHYRTYDGMPKEKKDIALLVGVFKYTSFDTEDSIVSVVSVDHKTGFRGSRWDGEYEIELLPGPHDIEVRFRSGNLMSTETRKMTLNAEPGQVYMIKPNLAQTRNYWAPSFVNITDSYEWE